MAITPQAGYQVSPTDPNSVVPIGSSAQAQGLGSYGVSSSSPLTSAATTPAQSAPTAASTPAPAPAPATTPSAPAPSTQAPTAPSTNLQPGATGQDVSQLQQYLIQQGYASPDQIQKLNAGMGTYGPTTTAAVAAMQSRLGLNPTTGSGSYGPQTRQALANKYGNIFSAVKDQGAPSSMSSANSTIQGLQQTDTNTNPVYDSLTQMYQPIFSALTQVLSNINNPALTAVSLQDEYNQLAKDNNIPQMRTDLLNMNRIMQGTEQDVRDEVTKAGGFATDSQVLGITASRNKVILKQYNALSTNYDAAVQNVQNQMQYASTDISNSLQRQQMNAQISESMATIQGQMINTGITMQKNARDAAQYNVTQMGYSGLAAATAGNPKLQSYYENLLSLQPGSLSDPTALAAMDTYKQQQLQINNYRAAIAAYSAGYGGGGLGGGNPYQNSTPNGDPISPTNPGGTPQGPGTAALASGLLLEPNSAKAGNSIMQATGLNLNQFNALTGAKQFSGLPRGQKLAITNSLNDWLQNAGVDMATFQSQYKTLNTNINDYTTRYNQMGLAEANVNAAIPTISPAAEKAGLGDVNIANVVSLWKGQQVNDPKANEYMLYFKDLQNSLAYFYASQRGNKSADDGDVTAAAKVITEGLSSGGLKGISDGFKNISQRENYAMASSVDNVNKQLYDLFGVGDKYKSINDQQQQSVQMLTKSGSPVYVTPDKFDAALQAGYKLAGNSLPSIPIQ